MDNFDSSWFASLRVVLNRAVDALEESARTDPELARALSRLLQPPDPGSAVSASAGLVEKVPPTPQRQADEAAPPPATGPLVPRALKLGDAGVMTVRARHSQEDEREAARVAALSGGRAGPQVVAEAWSHPALSPRAPVSAEDFDPQRLMEQLRIKASACRWQGERGRRLDAGEDVREADHALVARAAERGCWLWMVQPARWRERGERAFNLVAGCYDALADAVELMDLADTLGREEEAAMNLLAEASSGLRAALEDYASTGRDRDQEIAFRWLDDQTHSRSIYIPRYMRLDDPAAPDNWPDLRRRIEEVSQQLRQLHKGRRVRDNLFSKISYSLKKLQDATPPDEELNPEHAQFRTLQQAVADLLADGVPPSDRRFRDYFIPVLGRMPAQVSPEVSRVLDEVDAYLDALDVTEPAEEQLTGQPDGLVEQARQLTRGLNAVLIGGIPDEQARRRLESDLALESLNWLRVEHGQSFDAAAVPALRDERVSLVFVMTRWRSHRDGPEARRICRERRIPLVELPAGYGTRRVAHEILRQASEQLQAAS